MKKEQQLLDIIKKWSSNKVAFPDSWSDEKQLETTNLSYKTYDGGARYKNIVITVGGTIKYEIDYRGDTIEVSHPLAFPLTAAKALELVTTIYTEAMSLESMVEGRAKLREDIAKLKADSKTKAKEARKLEETLKLEAETKN